MSNCRKERFDIRADSPADSNGGSILYFSCRNGKNIPSDEPPKALSPTVGNHHRRRDRKPVVRTAGRLSRDYGSGPSRGVYLRDGVADTTQAIRHGWELDQPMTMINKADTQRPNSIRSKVVPFVFEPTGHGWTVFQP